CIFYLCRLVDYRDLLSFPTRRSSDLQNFPIFSSFKDNEDFYFSMTSYLNEFYDPHLKIIDKKGPYPNIRVQLYEDKLYVIESKNKIGRAHVLTPVTFRSRMPYSA